MKNIKLKICSLFLVVVFLATATPVLAEPKVVEKPSQSVTGSYVIKDGSKSIRYNVSSDSGNGGKVYQIHVAEVGCREVVARRVGEGELIGYMMGHFKSHESPEQKRTRESKERYARSKEEAARRGEEEDSSDSDSDPAAIHRLCKAAEDGDLDKVRSLIDSGVNPNRAERVELPWGIFPHGTPLIYAANSGHEDCIRLLLEKGAKPNVVALLGSPLQLAAKNGSDTCVRLLLEHGADPNYRVEHARGSSLFWAVKNCSDDCVRLLLEHGADPNIYVDDNSDERMKTPLYCAAEKGRDTCVRLLLEKGAKITGESGGGGRFFWRLPLCGAAAHGHEACVRLLLDAGADPNQDDRDGLTPLLCAVVCATEEGCNNAGCKACVKLLLDRGADPNWTREGHVSTLRNICDDPEIDALLKAHGVKKPGFFKRALKRVGDVL